MKRVISLLLSVLMVVSVAAISTNAFADGWIGRVQNVDYDMNYDCQLDVGNPDYSSMLSDGYYYPLKISVPEKGSITYYAECSSKSVIPGDVTVYKTTDLNNEVLEFGEACEYNSAYGVYYLERTFNLNKGDYYLLLDIYDYSDDIRDGESDGSFAIRLSYKPSFANTTIKALSPKAKAFSVKWNKASGVTGYEIQYSLKRDMSGAKKVKVNNASTASKTIKGLKSKKNYYVRIRTYKTMNINYESNTYYGKWSAKKTVKTK